MKTAIVTGAAGGIGLETALELARRNFDVVLAGRNPEKGQRAVERIQQAVPGASVRHGDLDLASLASVERFAQNWSGPLDLLINNAGVMAFPTRQITKDGFEAQFGTNHLGHFALTLRLLPHLKGGRVVNVSSMAHRSGRMQFDDLQFERYYRPWPAYQQSKLANLLFTFELQRRSVERDWGLIANAAHPGYAHTDLITNGPGARMNSWSRLIHWLGHSAVAGAQPTLLAALEGRPMGYYGPQGWQEMKGPPGEAVVAPRGRSEADAVRLWEVSERLVGLKV